MTPMMQQYFEIKNKYPDFILFYRLGDFYEMFFDDAQLASSVLGITLTGRDCRLIERELAAQGIHVFSRELSSDYQVLFAVRACQEDIGEDFFDVIPARDFNAIMKRVQSFLLRAE